MATTQKRLVNKQFNSPIGLYSEDNILKTLDRELKQLGCGAIGIDFDDPTTTKPSNLAKSAVLQALEEEERQTRGLKRVAWPPQETESQEENSPIQEPLQQQYNAPVQVNSPQPKAQSQERLIPIQRTGPIIQPTVYLNGGGPKPLVTPVINYHRPTPVSPQYHPINPTQFVTSSSSLSPSTNTAGSSPLIWNHVSSPVPKLGKIFTGDSSYVAPPFKLDLNPQFVQQQQPYYQTQPQHQPQTQAILTPSYVSVSNPVSQHQTCQGLVTIRQEAPVTQQPAPVYTSQPVAAIYQGGSNMPGDDKWPPVAYKQQSEVDNEARKKIAAQPIFRPRRPQKDYSDFFAKNALNSTYPGYRPPPGTQHHSTPM